MLDRVLEFTGALRNAGVPVAVSEDMDALRAAGLVPWEDREALKAAFAATMVKSAAHKPAFDTLFDLYFGAGRGPEALEERDAADEPMQPWTSFSRLCSPVTRRRFATWRAEPSRSSVASKGRTPGRRTSNTACSESWTSMRCCAG
jgi:uncharacterized protein with von Willebrand factor type A (vWA) domain